MRGLFSIVFMKNFKSDAFHAHLYVFLLFFDMINVSKKSEDDRMGETRNTKQILAEALIMLCEKKSFSKITIQEITNEVGVNRQLFYYHFVDKYDLLRWIYANDALIYLASTEITRDNWEEQTLKMLKAIKEKHVFYYNTVCSEPDVLREGLSEITNSLLIHLFEQMDQEKQLRSKDKTFYARFFSYGCSGVLINWIDENFQETPLEIATQLFRLAKDTEFFSYQLYIQENEL